MHEENKKENIENKEQQAEKVNVYPYPYITNTN